MVAAFPNSIATSGAAGTTLPQNTDGSDIVLADDVNDAYNEIVAIETALGVTPTARSAAWGTGTFSTASTSFASVDARIKNVEDGTHTSYLALNFSGTVAYIDGGTSAAF